jgi:hypothetical protein
MPTFGSLTLADTYVGYFTTRAPDALLPPLQYVLCALVDPDAGICLVVRLFLCLGCIVLFWRAFVVVALAFLSVEVFSRR